MKNNWLSYFCAVGLGTIISKFVPPIEVIGNAVGNTLPLILMGFILPFVILCGYSWIQETDIPHLKNDLKFYQKEQSKLGVIVCSHRKYLQLSRMTKKVRRKLKDYQQFLSKLSRYLKCFNIFLISLFFGIISGSISYYGFFFDPKAYTREDAFRYTGNIVGTCVIPWIFIGFTTLTDLTCFESIHYNRKFGSVTNYHYNSFRCIAKAVDNLIITDNLRHSINHFFIKSQDSFNEFLVVLYNEPVVERISFILFMFLPVALIVPRVIIEIVVVNPKIIENNITDLIKI